MINTEFKGGVISCRWEGFKYIGIVMFLKLGRGCVGTL